MEHTVMGILIVLGFIGVFLYSRRRNKSGGGGRPDMPIVPNIPEYEAEKDGDVNNGSIFTSVSSSFAPQSQIINIQRINADAEVVATQQIESSMRKAVLGKVIKSETEELPVPLDQYKFKATIVGDRLTLSPPLEGTLADFPVWTLIHEPVGFLKKRLPSRSNTLVYLEIEAPEGYKSGVVVLELIIETGL